jgi:hydrogenase maturation protein HypF
VNVEEEKLLSGTLRPIVLLTKRPDCPVSTDVAPNQKYQGVMLPYTPLHQLIVAESGLVLVMTSGNISSEPIVYYDEEAFDRLKNIADVYCIHNREIHIRTDDSVSRIWRGKEVVLRRSRGFAPYPLLLNFSFKERILDCGAELKIAFCLTRDNFAFMSHHIGDLENLETLTSFEKGIEHFKRIFNIEPTLIATEDNVHILKFCSDDDFKDGLLPRLVSIGWVDPPSLGSVGPSLKLESIRALEKSYK